MLSKIALVLSLVILISCTASINETVYVKDGEVKRGDINSVNGSIIIGKDCKVYGDCRAINGSIEVGENSLVNDLVSVNGKITIGKNSRVEGDISAVNGSVACAEDGIVYGDVSTVNGEISLTALKVMSDVETVNGDIILEKGTIVEQDIIIKGKGKSDEGKRRLDIWLNGESQVKGDIVVQDENLIVKVYLDSDCRIGGDVINAEIVYQ